jgi:hypothetical protein
MFQLKYHLSPFFRDQLLQNNLYPTQHFNYPLVAFKHSFSRISLFFLQQSSQNFKILSKTHPISTAHDHRSSPSTAVRRPPLFAAHQLRPFSKSSPLHRTSPPSNESIATQRHPSTTAALRHPGASATDPRYSVAVSSSAARFSGSLQPTHLSLAFVTCFGATHSLSSLCLSVCIYRV